MNATCGVAKPSQRAYVCSDAPSPGATKAVAGYRWVGVCSVTDVDRAFFHSAGKTADGARDVYNMVVESMRDENGRSLGYCWRCECGRCKSVPIGPFQSREVAREHLNKELGAVIDDIKITEMPDSGVQ